MKATITTTINPELLQAIRSDGVKIPFLIARGWETYTKRASTSNRIAELEMQVVKLQKANACMQGLLSGLTRKEREK
jgi:hypothetical protein